MGNGDVSSSMVDLIQELIKFLSDPNRKDCSSPPELLRRIFQIYKVELVKNDRTIYISEDLIRTAYKRFTNKNCPSNILENFSTIEEELLKIRDSWITDDYLKSEST